MKGESEKETESKIEQGSKNRERRAKKEEQNEENRGKSITGKGQKKEDNFWIRRRGHSVKTGRSKISD